MACVCGTRGWTTTSHATPAEHAALPTTFHLVRHATHGLLPHTLAGRMPGVALNEVGRAQAASLADHFRDQPIAAVIASPVQRAGETAAPVAAALGLVPETDAGFEEIDFGAWTGRQFEELASDVGWQRWNRLRSLTRCPFGETMAEAQSRALDGLARLRHRFGDVAVIVVSHADILKSILAAALGLSLDHIQRFNLDPASISTLLLFDDATIVDGINR